MGDVVRCPNCNGKGHVMDGGQAVLTMMLAGLGALLIPFERNNPNGITRCECERCDGDGWVERRIKTQGGREGKT